MEIQTPYPYYLLEKQKKLSIEKNEESGRVTIAAKERRYNNKVMEAIDAFITKNNLTICCYAISESWTPRGLKTVTILFRDILQDVKRDSLMKRLSPQN